MDIKKRIKEAGMTVSEVAAKMPRPDGGKGIAQASLSAIINGNPTINKLKDIADILGVSLAELVSDDDDSCSQSLSCPHCGKPIHLSLTVEKVKEPVKREVPRRRNEIRLVSEDGALYCFKNPRTPEEKNAAFELQGIGEEDGMYNVRNIYTREVLDIESSRLKKML